MQVLTRMFARMQVPAIVKPVIGGAVFGLVGVVLPLTMFTGSAQLKTVLADGGTLGLGLLGVIIVAKMFTFAISGASGFIGGPIFPALFIGGSAGVFVHELIPGMPLGLTFTCLLAAVPGALMPAPFSMVLDGRVPDPGRRTPDGADPDRRDHRLPGHGGGEVPCRRAGRRREPPWPR